MEEGHFENLLGKVKPLNLNSNPHADPAEDTLYRILSKNNCAPEWVELNKGIRSDIANWRLTLKKACAYKESGDISKWNEYSDSLKAQIRSINNKVFRYNLIVPFGRQMNGLNWEKELARLNEVQEIHILKEVDVYYTNGCCQVKACHELPEMDSEHCPIILDLSRVKVKLELHSSRLLLNDLCNRHLT
ncbi:dnaJ-like protein [Artemisia annua]|uniref:DnaJ-like protein n=1 Tax=Artemisia annua TaxID=35608 RepID=A0A2U1NSJ5_ARTAN|nr:dnaJ-like protein [Artemisia annua]